MKRTHNHILALLFAPLAALHAAEGLLRTEMWTENWPNASGAMETRTVTAEVWTQAMQAALDADGKLHIPAREKPYYLDGPLILKSGQKLTAGPNPMSGFISLRAQISRRFPSRPRVELPSHPSSFRIQPSFAPRSPQTPSLPDARPRSDRPRCDGRESNFLAVNFLAVAAGPSTDGLEGVEANHAGTVMGIDPRGEAFLRSAKHDFSDEIVTVELPEARRKINHPPSRNRRPATSLDLLQRAAAAASAATLCKIQPKLP